MTRPDILFRCYLALFPILAALLVVFQAVSLSKLGVIPPAVSYSTFSLLASAITSSVPISTVDIVLAVSIASCAAAIIAGQVWRGWFTRAVALCLATRARVVGSLIAAALLAVRFYFAPGEINWAADSGPHIAYAWIASQAFADGDIPTWTNYLGAGSPYCRFYGFLFYYVAGLVDQVVGDIHGSLKVTLAAGHVLSGLTAFFWARARGIRPGYAVIAGLAYVLTFWHTQQALIMGRFPVAWVYALIPLPFAFVERLVRAPSPRIDDLAGCAFALALVTFTHPGYGLWATAFVSLYAAVRLASAPFRRAFHVSAAIVLGTCLGGYLTAGMALEYAPTGVGGFSLVHLPDPSWHQLVTWSNFRYNPAWSHARNWYGGYLGLTVIGFALLSLAGGRRLIRQRSFAPLVCLLVSLVLVFAYRTPLAEAVPGWQAFNAGRYLLFTALFLSALAPDGLTALHRLLRRHRPQAFTAWAILLLAVDLGPTTFQQPYPSTPQHIVPERYLAEARDDLLDVPAGEIPARRNLYLSDVSRDYLNITWLLVKTGVPTALGVFDESLRATWGFAYPFKQHLLDVVKKDPHLSDSYDAVSGLAFLLNNDITYVDPRDGQIRKFVIPSRSPIVVAGRSSAWDRPFDRANPADDFDVRVLLGMLQADAGRLAVDEIPLLGAEAETLSPDPSCRLIDHRVTNASVRIHAEVDAPCFARLAYAHYPDLRVTVNGRDVETFETAGRFAAIRLDAGVHDIEITAPLSLLRRAFLWLNILSVAAYLAFVIQRRRKRKHREEVAT